MDADKPRKIVMAGGGTAGHVEPALAMARAWRTKHSADSLLFLGTSSGLENSLVPAAGFTVANIPKVAMPRSIGIDFIKLPFLLWSAVREARKVIKGADLLVGFGGYLSASAYIAARMARVPIVIHEANAKVGWANRLGSFFTRCIAIAHPIEFGRFSGAYVTGLPLREDVKAAVREAASNWEGARIQAKRELGWEENKPLILILGGSQGSTFINAEISYALPSLTTREIQILHSVGSGNELPASSQYYRAVPYIRDMATAYLAADLIIARSGAVTCAEVGALGRRALFIPLPIGNGEQARNADFLVQANRALVVDQKTFSSTWLLAHLDDLLLASAQSPFDGLNDDLGAEDKIMALMERAINGQCK
ncbi:MAG: UDP-N-acetylglucosamine--N-acetylmuramyl-(pentapeptide) pyrophosphoryl-undecaprenol N-acetylglucosamine transferase [Candidatus Nanopelagicaceae bacterium]|nr:UDP-N-acetylglucosamine--N-acetylmuramyl-(pentapeptide) pyrophosphoryl-undecaprenol N-acetylglucosamine transferase [Candidatus Nanopelagicaceae bacterium]